MNLHNHWLSLLINGGVKISGDTLSYSHWFQHRFTDLFPNGLPAVRVIGPERNQPFTSVQIYTAGIAMYLHAHVHQIASCHTHDFVMTTIANLVLHYCHYNILRHHYLRIDVTITLRNNTPHDPTLSFVTALRCTPHNIPTQFDIYVHWAS